MDVVDHLGSRLGAGDVSVVASASFPEVSHNPSFVFGTAGRSLLGRFEDLGHVIPSLGQILRKLNGQFKGNLSISQRDSTNITKTVEQ